MGTIHEQADRIFMGSMMSGMNSMMGWMMGVSLLGWALFAGLLVAVVVLVVGLLSRE